QCTTLAGSGPACVPTRRTYRNEPHVKTVRLINPEKPHDRRRRLCHEQGEPVAPLAAAGSQGLRELVRQAFQLGVGQLLVTEDDGHGLGPPLGLSPYPLVEELWHFDTSSAC